MDALVPPSVVEYLPAAQFVHVVSPDWLHWPESHWTHTTAEDLVAADWMKEPAGHDGALAVHAPLAVKK